MAGKSQTAANALKDRPDFCRVSHPPFMSLLVKGTLPAGLSLGPGPLDTRYRRCAMMLLGFGLVGAAAVVGGLSWWFLSRQRRREQSFFFRCAACGQKLRYLARKAGQRGKCPRCNQGCTFPSQPQEVATNAGGDEPRVRFGRLSRQPTGGRASVS
jgi:hypothetical protein